MRPYAQTHTDLIAAMLGGSWRLFPPEPDISAKGLTTVGPLLLRSGAGGLGWWKIRGNNLNGAATALDLFHAYRFHAIHTSLYQHKIKQAFSLLRSIGVEPILIKGWANARIYPEVGLRPYSDVDLCVRPDQYGAAEAVLKTPAGLNCRVDLHKGLGRLDERGWDYFYARSYLVRLDEADVRVLSPEDHIHIISFHMLEDGAWRPILLCDVAAAVEAASSTFDWDACLGKNERRAQWIASSIGLAHQLLGARIERCSLRIRRQKLPTWLIPAVRRQWTRPGIDDHSPPELIAISLRHPARMPRALLRRWPDPIGATIRSEGAFNEFPRLPFQARDYLFQSMRFLERLPRLLQNPR